MKMFVVILSIQIFCGLIQLEPRHSKLGKATLTLHYFKLKRTKLYELLGDLSNKMYFWEIYVPYAMEQGYDR